MRGAYAAFSLVRAIKHASGAVVLGALLGIYFLAKSGALVYCLLAVLLWVLLRHRARAGPSPTMQDRLLRARVLTAETKLAILSPDVAQAARDYEAGRITLEDYATALDYAARQVHNKHASRASRRTGPLGPMAPLTAQELRALYRPD